MAVRVADVLSGRRLVRRIALLAAPFAALQPGQAQAQETGRLLVAPSLTVQETLTTNRDLTASNERADAITQISPRVRISSRSGRVRGALDYSLNILHHARDGGRTDLQNALAANLNAELVENHVFVDAASSISQQTISAFGTQAGGTGLVNGNTSEVSTLYIAPSLRGNLAGIADVQARAAWAASRSAGTALGDRQSLDASFGASGGRGYLGWGLDASRQVSKFAAGRQMTQDMARATLSFVPDPDMRLSVRGGREANDVVTGGRRARTTWGLGASWKPGPRTSLELQSDRRYFGSSHSVAFQHRMARSIWRYTDSRGSAGDAASAQAGARPVSLFDLFFAQFASIEPDPVRREQLVRTFLLTNGLDPNSRFGGGFLSSGLTLQRIQNASIALTGARSTVTFSAFRSASSRLGSSPGIADDLSLAPELRQLGYSVGVSHRLTPTSALALTASLLKTLAAGVQAGNDQRLLSLMWSGTLGPRTSGTVGLRHVAFASPTNPYQESALLGSISLRF